MVRRPRDCDPIEAAYYGVYVWKMTADEKAGSFDVDKGRRSWSTAWSSTPLAARRRCTAYQPTHLQAGLHR